MLAFFDTPIWPHLDCLYFTSYMQAINYKLDVGTELSQVIILYKVWIDILQQFWGQAFPQQIF